MNKKLLLIISALATGGFVLFYFSKAYNESKLDQCMQQAIHSLSLNNIETTTNDRGEKPIISGTTSPENKKLLLSLIHKNCKLQELQDFIDVKTPLVKIHPSIHFKIDGFNNRITVKGQIGSQHEKQDILKSFAIGMPQMSTEHLINIDKNIPPTDYAIYITLLLSSIDEIKGADITIENKILIIKGLIRNQQLQLQSMSKLHQLFDDEFEIINQLVNVIQIKTEIEPLKFNLNFNPTIESPIKN